MPRVTAEEVAEIIDVDATITSITAFIAAANVYVTNTLGASVLDDVTLKEIERWLSAHFIAIRDPRPTKEKISDGEADYNFKIGYRLYLTPYGQQACLLDSTGTLKALEESLTSAKQPLIEVMP